MGSFIEKMKDSITVAIEAFGLQADALVANDDMVIVMNPREKSGSQGKSTHGGYAGKSLIEKIREDLDSVFSDAKDHRCDTSASCESKTCGKYENPFAEGMCQALGTLRGTSCDEEWKMAEYRYAQKENSS